MIMTWKDKLKLLILQIHRATNARKHDDVMMILKIKTNKCNSRKTPGHYIHWHMDFWGCRSMRILVYMLQIAKIIMSWSVEIILHRLLHKVRTRASRYSTHIIGSSNINKSIICIYIRSLEVHDTVVDCSWLMMLSS